MNQKTEKLMKQAMHAGFNGGWAAALVSLAQTAEEGGDPEFGAWLRKRALQPDRVEIVDMDSPEGRALDALPTTPAAPAPAQEET